jgi:hypothetical protein
MHPVTTRPSDVTHRNVQDIAEERENNASKVVRQLVEKGLDYDDLEADYQTRIEDLEQDIERLQNEKHLILEDREEKTELVAYVERERDLQDRCEERRGAPMWTRAKWYVFGRDRAQTEQ